MLRQPKCTQPTPLTQPAWNAYLNQHFRPSAARGVQPQGLGVGSGLSARDMAVPLGRNHHPPEVLLQQGAQNDWMPAPDTIDPPSSDTMLALAEQIGKMNGHASPGYDCVAASFIKNAVVVRPKPDGRGSERVNVLAPSIAQLINLLYDKARVKKVRAVDSMGLNQPTALISS